MVALSRIRVTEIGNSTVGRSVGIGDHAGALNWTNVFPRLG